MNNPNRVRKAVFPVAGLGTRFLPATKSIPKEMLTVVDRPLIQYAVEEAVAAGITEEFLFRGALQRIIGKWTYNHHIIIWSAAIIFSTFHMQFFGFLPRMLLGAYFGYLLYWTRNIWIPVFAHFVNNAIAVISMSDASLKDNEFITGDISTQNLLPYTIVAIVALFFFVRCCRKLKIIRSSNLNS